MSKKEISWKELPEEIRAEIVKKIKVKYIVTIVLQFIAAVIGTIIANMAYNVVASNNNYSDAELTVISAIYIAILVLPFVYTIPRKVVVLIGVMMKKAKYTTLNQFGYKLEPDLATKNKITVRGKRKYKINIINKNGMEVKSEKDLWLVRPFSSSTYLFAVQK